MENSDHQKLIKSIRQLREAEPPPELLQQVMQRVTKPKKNRVHILFTFFFTPRSVQFRPITGAALCCSLVLVFFTLATIQQKTVPHPPVLMSETRIPPVDGEASFVIGRTLMEAGYANEALPLLQKASLSQPTNPKFAYWEGLCFWANGMQQQERSSYLRGIEADPEATVLRLNLAHSYLSESDFNNALNQYEAVLALEPSNQTALYNRALLFHLQKNQEQEKAAWHTYLRHYSLGSQAFRAVHFLNSIGDFTYRTYNLGKRKAILNQSALLGLDTKEAFARNIAPLIHALHHDPALSLHIIGFSANNGGEARETVRALKRFIIRELGENQANRVSLSWFEESEKTATGTGEKEQAESLLIFASVNNQPNMETTI